MSFVDELRELLIKTGPVSFEQKGFTVTYVCDQGQSQSAVRMTVPEGALITLLANHAGDIADVLTEAQAVCNREDIAMKETAGLRRALAHLERAR